MTQSNGTSIMVQGRIVWVSGDLFAGKQKMDYNTNAPVFDQAGQPKMEYGFGLAVAKINPQTGQQSEEFKKVWEALHKEAYTLYPNGNIPPNFAMKYKDGEEADHNGRPFADREGYAGHIVLSCTTAIAIKFFRFEGGNNIIVNDGIKNGDYVQVQLNIKAHPAKGNGNAGLYLNPNAVQLIQSGKEIINSPSGDQIFGQSAPVYSGQVIADQTPTMPNVSNTPTTTAAPTAPTMPPSGVVPAATPHYDVLPPQHHPVAPGNAPAAPTAPTMPPSGVVPAATTAPNVYPSNPTVPVQGHPGQQTHTAPPMPGMPTAPGHHQG